MRVICFFLGHKPERLLARLCQGIYRDCGEYHYYCCRCHRELLRTVERLYVREGFHA